MIYLIQRYRYQRNISFHIISAELKTTFDYEKGKIFVLANSSFFSRTAIVEKIRTYGFALEEANFVEEKAIFAVDKAIFCS